MHELFNLQMVPFSRKGSYMAISYMQEGEDHPEGLYLRSIHAQARRSDVFRFLTLDDSEITTQYTPTKLILNYSGTAEIIFSEENAIRIKGQGAGLKLLNCAQQGKHIIEFEENFCVVHMGTQYIQYGVRMLTGTLKPVQDWNGHWSDSVAFEFHPDQGGNWECEIRDYPTAYYPQTEKVEPFASAAKRVEQEFTQFYENMPAVPAQYEALREFAAYVDWSCLVAPRGIMKRYGMLMSKNWMCNVWSWDHCFNAMALAGGDPELAFDQLMGSFDHADEFGSLPDLYNNSITTRINVKPPIHGWTLAKLMERHTYSTAQLQEAYDRISAWTNWWTQLRTGKNGLPYYYHGNDSGWDNSTVFHPVMPVSSPELVAFLIVQMNTLSKVADRLGKTAEAKEWSVRTEDYKKMLIEHYWTGSELVTVDGKGNQYPTTSLLPFMTVMLGEELPEELREYVVSNILKPVEEGGFLTPYGLMTEQLNSGYYVSDGYWLGPIWAPSTMICVDGLYRLGYREEARMLSLRFAELCNKGGFAENFEAMTGQGLRDRAYTWTSSVFLTLMRDYLD